MIPFKAAASHKMVTFEEVSIDGELSGGRLSEVKLDVQYEETTERISVPDQVTRIQGYIEIEFVHVESIVTFDEDGNVFREWDREACDEFTAPEVEEIIEACGGIEDVYERIR